MIIDTWGDNLDFPVGTSAWLEAGIQDIKNVHK